MCWKERNSTCTLRTRSAFWEVSSSTFLRRCSTMAGFSGEVPSVGESASRPRDCLDSNFSAPDTTWTERFHLICSRPFSSSSTHFWQEVFSAHLGSPTCHLSPPHLQSHRSHRSPELLSTPPARLAVGHALPQPRSDVLSESLAAEHCDI